jgi:NCS1 family nucleobase:cation symporter-1
MTGGRDLDATAASFGVEQHTTDFVPLSERHGRPRSLFAVWFASNMQITTIVTGALGVVVGLPLPSALAALVLGNLVGAVFMAMHSAQGPKLGIPQMIQSRAQFGFYGAVLPLLLVLLMYIGFFASSTVLASQALGAWWHISPTLAGIIVSALCTVLAVFGYRAIHRVERIIAVVAVVAFLVLSVRLFTEHSVGHAWHAGGHTGVGTFLLVTAIAATWQITYAPYVADYSRYLPEDTSVRAAFWWTYGGSALASIWMMAFGSIAAAVASEAFNSGSSSFIVSLAPGGLGWLVSLVLVLGVVAIQVLNLYGMFMSMTTTVTALARFRVNTPVRAGFLVLAAVVGTTVGLVASSNFISNFENFILFLAYFLIPWTAINLADFYLVRHGRYDVDAIFDPNGIYRKVNWRAIGAYLVAVAVEVPFMSTTFYTGPMVAHLGGADISWIFGLIVAAGLYAVLLRGDRTAAPAAAVAERDPAAKV